MSDVDGKILERNRQILRSADFLRSFRNKTRCQRQKNVCQSIKAGNSLKIVPPPIFATFAFEIFGRVPTSQTYIRY